MKYQIKKKLHKVKKSKFKFYLMGVIVILVKINSLLIFLDYFINFIFQIQTTNNCNYYTSRKENKIIKLIYFF